MSKKVYTKKGDGGHTSLIGGTRVKKNDIRIEAYGTLDELSAFLGLLRNSIGNNEDHAYLYNTQKFFFAIGAFLATDITKTTVNLSKDLLEKHILEMENKIDVMEHKMPDLNDFIVPGSSSSESISHICRTVCRRLERHLCVILENSDTEKLLLSYFNRLSDYLFVFGRFIVFSSKSK